MENVNGWKPLTIFAKNYKPKFDQVLNTTLAFEQVTSFYYPAKTLRKSNVILLLYFGNLGKLLSTNVDVT